MSTEFYGKITASLPPNLKMKARIEGLRFEKELYNLNIEYLNTKINNVKKTLSELTNAVEEQYIRGYEISIMEFEVKIMEFQTKIKMCEIQSIREEFNLKNYKEF